MTVSRRSAWQYSPRRQGFDQWNEKRLAERTSTIRYLLEQGANPNYDCSHLDMDTLFQQCLRQEGLEIIRLFRQHGATLPESMIIPLLTIWMKVQAHSDLFKEVWDILIEDHADSPVWKEPPESIFHPLILGHCASAAAPILGATVGMGYGASRLFGQRQRPRSSNRRRNRSRSNSTLGARAVMADIIAGRVAAREPGERKYVNGKFSKFDERSSGGQDLGPSIS